jgi:Type IV secretion-system coupling protein DNA-binding domain
MRRLSGNKLELGIVDGKGVPLVMTPEMRSTHLYCCGSTGTGKSKMLEHLIRQDIQNLYKTKCGALIIDPHGSLYNSLINWIAWNEPHLKDVPIVPIDLRQKDWTIGYNVMRQRTVADPSVVVSNFVQAMSYVWGADGTDRTPLFARLGKEVLWPLYEKKMTLLETEN